MFFISNVQKLNVDNFYSPTSISGYLTPLQRKKLREKRNTPLSLDINPDFKTPKSSKVIRKTKQHNFKPKTKVKTVKEQPRTKNTKENLPTLRYSVAGLVAQDKSDNYDKEKRFFKCRSPKHLQKAEFVLPLTYKKRRLDFSGENKNSSKPLRPIQGSQQNTYIDMTAVKSQTTLKSDNLAKLNLIESVIHPTLVKVTTTNKVNNSVAKVYEKKSIFPENSAISCSSVNTLEPAEVFNSQISEIRIGNSVFNFEWPSDEELLKRENEARAELRKSLSASKERALLKKSSSVGSDESQNVSSDEGETQQKSSPKLFPIFSNKKAKGKDSDIKRSSQKKIFACIRDVSKGDEQMIIDAGQKEIGAKLCKTCNMLYTIGQEEDERLHSSYHHTFLVNLKFLGWKNELIVGEFDDGRIIKVLDTDKNFKLRKVQDVLSIANRDLGFSSVGFPSKPNIMFFLFISNDRRVGGCLVAEPIEFACPVVLGNETVAVKESDEKPIWKLGNWYASTKPVPAICGINRIWVSKEFRRCKVASRLVDCLRGSFIYGHVVDFREMAFTDPSPDGREFAASYTGTDNFLVYK